MPHLLPFPHPLLLLHLLLLLLPPVLVLLPMLFLLPHPIPALTLLLDFRARFVKLRPMSCAMRHAFGTKCPKTTLGRGR